jgi:hypothetical protein
MYRVSFSKRILGVPFAIAAAKVKFARLFGLPHWRARPDVAEIEQLGSVPS